ncbi:unnamed protein product, partial [Symbiodinium microadriaticum]
ESDSLGARMHESGDYEPNCDQDDRDRPGAAQDVRTPRSTRASEGQPLFRRSSPPGRLCTECREVPALPSGTSPRCLGRFQDCHVGVRRLR